MKSLKTLRAALLGLLISIFLLSSLFVSSAQLGGGLVPPAALPRPQGLDVRGAHGVPKGTELRSPTGVQLKHLKSLEARVGAPLRVEYNGLTATPRHLFSYGTYLTPPSGASAETIARDFISRNREIFRFSESDLSNLRLKSRTTLPDTGVTILLFEQTVNGIGVYKGEVLVNVNRAGQIISVGGESYPQMAAPTTFTLTPAQAVTSAATQMGFVGFVPQAKGTKKVLKTFGDVPPEYVDAARFGGANKFTGDIVVTRTIFPLGDTGRPAYEMMLTTPQFNGIMWLNIVDAQTGAVLRRTSLTAFQQGGGPQNNRRSTFRPDIQNLVESFNPANAAGKVFDGMPTGLSGSTCTSATDPHCSADGRGYGRPTVRGQAPDYAPETAYDVSSASGRGFRKSLVQARNQGAFANSPADSLFPVIFNTPFGQVTRGFPNAANPTPQSPFGWFYLPTNTGGAEITSANASRATTRGYGYTMTEEARLRNLAANSPGGDKSQPYSADVTPLSGSVTLADGRVLSSVIQSRYTEGNNAMVADDRANDDESTHGIRGYSATRQFTAGYFDFTNSYEFGNADAVDNSGSVTFPATADPDLYPDTTTLFYYNNIIHDYLYSVGFTEATWNFQQDNFGKGGAGADGVSVNAQDGSGTDNANFGTPNDGTAPRMQMYLFTDPGFRRGDGDLDWDIVAHEFYHGVSNRSVGKGTTDCLGIVPGVVVSTGEAGGQGEGWSDFFASSVADDDAEGEYATGQYDNGIRRLPYTNYRWSYKAIEGGPLSVRRTDPLVPAAPDAVNPDLVPFEVHSVGEVFNGMLWDLRELLIMKNPGGQFFDGDRRLGSGATFYIGNRQVQSVDSQHPINFRDSFDSTYLSLVGEQPRIIAAEHIVRPGRVAAEIQSLGHRNGPLASAVSQGARLADTLVLRGLQLSVCNPSIVDTRDSILLADSELTGGENRAIIWRAFASHGVGQLAASTAKSVAGGNPAENNPVIVEDFSVPLTVSQCETQGPLSAPTFSLANTANNQVTITINPLPNAALYIISRGDAATGPFTKIGETASTTFVDNNGGQGLPVGAGGNRTYYYQVRAARNDETPVAPQPNRDCISTSNTLDVLVNGVPAIPAPVFAGVEQVADPQDGTRLIVSWQPAFSLNPNASIVYDVFRVPHVEHGDGTQEPTFTPNASNRITPAGGVTGTSYVDTNVKIAQPYYYIVQARDTNAGKKDTFDAGNTVTKFNAPTTPQVTNPPVFALETFENASASSRFTPSLTESGSNPNQASTTFQRTTGPNVGGLGLTDGKMYAPDFSPGDELDGCTDSDPQGLKCGGQSDFSVIIGGTGGITNLTRTSVMEFDNYVNAENNFDGGVIEVAVGSPTFNSTPFPDNTTTWDVGNYIIQGGYNSKLDGAAPGSILQGRRAYSGIKPLHHVKVALNSFAPGGIHNPQGLPVYIRFRMTSDVASANGLDSGWYIDNLVINNLACSVNVATSESGATATASSEYPGGGFPASSAIDGEHKGTSWGAGGGWNDGTRDVYPDSLEVTFNGAKTLNEIRVYTVQNDYNNPVEPTPLTPATYNGIQDFEVQYWDGSQWVTVPGGSVTGNDKAMRIFAVPLITTTKLRVVVTAARNHYSRITELEAFGCGEQ